MRDAALNEPQTQFQFENTYAQSLKGFYVSTQGAQVPSPQVLRLNHQLADELGLDPRMLNTRNGAEILTGMSVAATSEPLAMAYAGHQFGFYSPRLGDGRALLLGELIDRNGQRRDLHLKGSGPTAYSRGGDGKAALGPVLREYLIGEAMHALAIPTTRALAVVSTGESIWREGEKRGAVLARVASSHLRVGSFQFFAAQDAASGGKPIKIRQLADYAIRRHYPELIGEQNCYLKLLEKVCERQAQLIARWMLAGFIHGVMNTDNMAISGETIDYGPCAFMDSYDINTVFSSIDHHGRYAYGNQPRIAVWNLARFAETLLDLVDPDDNDHAIGQATDILNRFGEVYDNCWIKGMRPKLGLDIAVDDDGALANGLIAAMSGQGVDYTLAFRHLAGVVRGIPLGDDGQKFTALFADPALASSWLDQYRQRLLLEKRPLLEIADGMDRVNPLYIARNHKVEEALAAAETGDMAPFDQLLELVSHPFETRAGADDYARPAPEDFGPYKTFCGT